MESQGVAVGVIEHAEMTKSRIGPWFHRSHCYSLSVADTASVELQDRQGGVTEIC
jgi:hypothetical protein